MMNFDKLITQHLEWKLKVNDFLNKENSVYVDTNEFAADNECELGQWLYSDEAKQLVSAEKLQEIISIHDDFHYLTKIILNNFQSGYYAAAKDLLSEYGEKSDTLVAKIKDIQALS